MNRNRYIMQAGVAEIEVNPPMDTPIPGNLGGKSPVCWVLDPIYFKALVLDDGNEKICIASTDLTLGPEYTERIRRAAEEKYGIKKDACILSNTTVHSSPNMGNFMVSDHFYDGPYGDVFLDKDKYMYGGSVGDAYSEESCEAMIKCIGEAAQNMQKVYVSSHRGIEGRPAQNRRIILRDGSAQGAGSGYQNKDIAYVEGPIDPEVGVVLFQTEKMECISVLLHYSMMPSVGCGNHFISADWPGAWCREVKKIIGDNCIPLVINGFKGNVTQSTYMIDGTHGVDHRLSGKVLCETTERIIMEYCGPFDVLHKNLPGVLDFNKVLLDIPYRDFDMGELERARELIKKHPTPIYKNEKRIDDNWYFALSLLDLYDCVQKDGTKFEEELNVIRIGDTAIFAAGGLMFVEGQLEIKLRSIAPLTMCTNTGHRKTGYLPAPYAFKTGGYEAKMCLGSKLYEGAFHDVVEKAVEMINDMFIP